MPKIIQNVRGRLIDEAKRQIVEEGYDSVTIRGIAKGCGLGLGTFYNYFKSKDMLIATFLLDDWKERMRRVRRTSENESDPMAVVHNVYDELAQFIDSNSSIFSSPGAIKAFYGNVGQKHKLLRAQIAKPICAICTEQGYDDPEFLSEFVAEAVLTWTVAQKPYGELEPVIKKLFSK